MLVAGLDVWKRGWVTVILSHGAVLEVRTYPTLDDFSADAPDVEVVGVDIPVILPVEPPRRADQMARDVVGPRRSSVFNAPPLEVLEAPTYAEALQRSRAQFGIGLSAQSYSLRTRILEAQRVARHDPRLVEVHPEVSFATMAGRHLDFAKKTWNGQALRRELLRRQGFELPDQLPDNLGVIPVDDVLDAAAAAWSANRKALGIAETLPPDPGSDEGAIWY